MDPFLERLIRLMLTGMLKSLPSFCLPGTWSYILVRALIGKYLKRTLMD